MPDHISTQLRLSAPRSGTTPGLVRRPHLEDHLSKGITRPVTLVTAGPGSGKTSTIAQWVSEGGAAPWIVAWVTIDTTDNTLATFWSDVLGALTVGGALPTDSRLRELAPATGFDAAEVLRIRVALSELPVPIVLVLDDFHAITSDVVLESVEELIDRQPPTLRLVLATRSDPKLRLHRLRMRGDLTEIRSADLAFTEQEAAELFHRNGIGVSEDQLRVLLTRTQGWPAGLRLAAMSLDAADIDGGITRFSGSDGSIAEYLIGEVTDRLSPDDRDFLLKTSVVERLHGDLAVALSGRRHGQLLLEQLVRSNAFVVALGGHNDWFAYHPLFREMLQHRLAVEQPDTVRDLHLRAARWYADAGDPIEGIKHAAHVKDWDEVGRLLTAATPLILTTQGPALAAALQPVAAQAIEHPGLNGLLAAAVCHYHQHDFETMRLDAAEAAEYLTDAPEGARPATEVLIATVQLAFARTRPGTLVQAATHLQDLLDRAPRRSVPAGRYYRVVATGLLGVGLLWAGDLAAAQTNLSAAETQARELGLELAGLNAQSHLALLDLFHGQLRSAHRRATTTLQALDRRGWGSEYQALTGYLTLGLTHLARNQLDQATIQIDRGLTVSSRTSDRACRLALGIAAVNIGAARGDTKTLRAAADRLEAERAQAGDLPDMLARWLLVTAADAHLAAGDPAAAIDRIDPTADRDGFAGAQERVILARAHLALDQPGQALQLLEPLLEPSVPYQVQAVEARILTAIAAGRMHHTAAALDAFTDAVNLAQPERLSQPFIAARSSISELLSQHRRVVADHLDFTHDIQTAITPEPAQEPPGTFEHLTDRELVVLRYLPTMLKAGEIASNLYLSVYTVKSHLRSIYRKLDVTTRKDAVDRARTMNLI